MASSAHTPEEVLRAFLAEALASEDEIRRAVGSRLDPLFRSVRKRLNLINFSSASSNAAFVESSETGLVTFYTGGFYSLRRAIYRLVGDSALTTISLYEISDAAYGLHELYHADVQGFGRFSVVQDHKKVAMGKDEIGKIDHLADNASYSMVAAVLAARDGPLTRLAYLQKLRDVSVLLNLAAPLAFGLSDEAAHKQKRRLANWMVTARVQDALSNNSISEVEEKLGPLDRALWMHFQQDTGDIVVWEPEPRHRVLGTARVKPETLLKALQYREHMDRGEILTLLLMFLQTLNIDAASIEANKGQQAPNQVS
jgi:hypothetical protein